MRRLPVYRAITPRPIAVAIAALFRGVTRWRTYPVIQPASVGWGCPYCERVNGPDVRVCPCRTDKSLRGQA